MSVKSLFSLQYFPSLTNSDGFFQKMIEREGAGARIGNQVLLLCLLSFIYGLTMGGYHSLVQAISAGVKVSLLFLLVLLICFPAFFIVQYILGSRLKLYQMMSIVLSGFILMSAIMVSFVPIVVIFLLTGSNYYFLQLLHILIFIFSGLFGMNAVVQALKLSCEKKSIYPQTGVVVFRFWVVILAFVGIQLAWNFRPFLGDRGEPFQLFRAYEGNFYTAVVYSVRKLVQSDIEAGKEQTQGAMNKESPNDVAIDTAMINAILKDSSLAN